VIIMGQPLAKHSQDIERFEARISTDKKNLLRNAAELSGKTLTDFVVNAAVDAAVQVIQEYQQLHLTSADRDLFIRALLVPPKASNNLLKAVDKYKKDVESK
jgi:uncharacterized protein (DUF1778 family)